MLLDFDIQLLKEVRSLGLDYHSDVGMLDSNDNIAISSLQGGVIIRQFYDGVADKQLPYEIAIKVNNDQMNAIQTLTTIANHLEQLEKLESENGSFDFRGVTITDSPYLVGQDENENFVYITNIMAELTVYKKRRV